MSFTGMNPDLFKVNSAAFGGNIERAKLVACGRTLMKEYGVHSKEGKYESLDNMKYPALNAEFGKQRVLAAAKHACDMSGKDAPASYEEFRRNAQSFAKDAFFLRYLQGLDTEIVSPILARTYTDAVEDFAEVVNVGFGETKVITIGSNDIPFFMDSSWGASRNVPENRLYDATYTLNPQPKTAKMAVKWVQFVGNDQDFGRYYNAIAAGMYAKTVAMWNASMVAATADTSIVPSNLSITYSTPNYIALANKLAALNSVGITDLICFGSMTAVSKVLPNGTSIDAALATLLGDEYAKMGYIGTAYGTRVRPLMDAIVPGTQNTDPTTVLPMNKAWLMASRGYKPITIGMNSDTPITLEYTPYDSADMMMGVNVTTALDMVATVASKIGVITFQ